jgi:hypothetical protein
MPLSFTISEPDRANARIVVDFRDDVSPALVEFTDGAISFAALSLNGVASLYAALGAIIIAAGKAVVPTTPK